VAASKDLGLGQVGVHGELRLASIWQPDLQVVNAAGSPIGYGETKVPGSATDFAKTLESEQVGRYRATIQNLLVTDFIHFSLFRTAGSSRRPRSQPRWQTPRQRRGSADGVVGDPQCVGRGDGRTRPGPTLA